MPPVVCRVRANTLATRTLALLAVVALLVACEPGREPVQGPGREPVDQPAPRPRAAGAPTAAPTVRSPRPTPTATATPGCADPLGCYGPPEHAGTFDVDLIDEASGLAASVRNPGVLYVLDDGPGAREVWAVRPEVGILGPVRVAGLVGEDTESLTVAPCGPGDPSSCVYVGDIGDNRRVREDVTVWRFPEPDLSAGLPAEPVAADAIRLRYPGTRPGGGPVDAEALLVGSDGVPLIVTKEAGTSPEAGGAAPGAARLLRAPGFADGVLTVIGPVPVPMPRRPLAAGVFGVVVTGADAVRGPDGWRVALRTYDHLVEYVAPDPAAPLEDFPTWPVREIPSPFEPQGEAVTYAADRCGLYTVSEQVGTIWFVPCDR
jgi:hypothetical protein